MDACQSSRMISDVHARIHDVLQQLPVISLVDGHVAHDQAVYRKAGIIPVMRKERSLHYFVMKPVAKHRHLDAPLFQLCKGTRMHRVPGKGWMDMPDGEAQGRTVETLEQTALREGMEELGLIPENIRTLFDVGPYRFSSSVSGKERNMWLFAAEIISVDDFLPDEDIAETTAARGWMHVRQFMEGSGQTPPGREDHVPIIGDIEKRLLTYYQELHGKH